MTLQRERLLGFGHPAFTVPGRVLVALILGLTWCAGCGSDSTTKPEPQAPVVHLLGPNGGENFLAGAQTEITWTTADGDTPGANLRIGIDFTPDGGTTWMMVATNEQNDGSFAWAVPVLATIQAQIRLTVSDGTYQSTDISDGPFVITTTAPPPRNTISAGTSSAAPGATTEVALALNNQDTAGLVEVRIWYDPAVADFRSLRLVERGVGLQVITMKPSADTVMVTLQQRAGIVINPGDGPVAYLSFQLVGAGGTQTALRPRQARFLDEQGTARSVRVVDGSLTVLLVDTPATLTAAGWSAFETGNLELAQQKFDAAIGLDAQYGPAYVGRGWVQLSRATTADAFGTAATSFDDAIGRGETGADAHGGRAAARLALGGDNLVGAIEEANAALAASPEFVFAHRTSFDWRDLHLIVAFAEAARGARFAAAREAADQVQDSGIRQGDPQTWVVEGVRYPTFETAVLAHLYLVSETYSG
jgi:hypothetical protein